MGDALTYAIVAVFITGSVGFIGNSMHESRHGRPHRVLRWVRNASIAIVWPLLVVRAVV